MFVSSVCVFASRINVQFCKHIGVYYTQHALAGTLSRVMTFPDGDPIRKKYFLLVIGFLQIVVCVFLVRPAAPCKCARVCV